MKIAGSILNLKKQDKQEVQKFLKSGIDFLHLDIMDGIFVEKQSFHFNYIYPLVRKSNLPLDIHLMVKDVFKYIYEFQNLNPEFITFHYEAVDNIEEVINYLKSIGIKVGISINPETSIDKIIPYLDNVDLVLLMSVKPGMGGQAFLTHSFDKLNKLYELKLENNYKFLIEVDGGINDTNIKLLKQADIVVVGNFLTKDDNYKVSLKKLKEEIK